MATNLPPPGPLTYEGQIVTPCITRASSPTTANTGFPVPTIWINPVIKKAWILVSIALGVADWVPIGGNPGEVESMTVDAFTAPGTNPVLPDSSASITITGAQVAAGVTANVIRTDSLAANTYTIEIQRSQAVATSTVGDNGVCHFDSSSFNVDANAFVTLKGGTEAIDSVDVDAHTAPGTDPVLPDANGLITVTGGQVAAGTTANVIRTDSLAANTYTIEIQRSQAAASSTVGDNGVCHFDNGSFAVDANGYVTLTGGVDSVLSVGVDAATGPGTNPVLPTVGGEIIVTGGQVAAGTTANVIRTDSLAANTYTVEVQRASAQAATTLAANGVAHFNNADFTVDANGFVSSIAGTAGISQVNIQTFTSNGTYTPTLNMKYCVVEIVGGGGGSGGAQYQRIGGNNCWAPGGGGGGGYARGAFSAATIGASQAVTIGTGGAGGNGFNAGAAGGTSSLGALISASGGGGGAVNDGTGVTSYNSGGAGGTAGGTFSVSITGSTGGFGYDDSSGGPILPSTGGASFLGMITPAALSYNTDGTAGLGYGSGGSGAFLLSFPGGVTVTKTGGTGAAGVCIVTEYI